MSRRRKRQRQQEIDHKGNSEAESYENDKADKNSFAQNLELGDFLSANDASKKGFNNISYSQSSESDDVMVGEFEDNDLMDDEYIAGLLDLESHYAIPGAQECSVLCFQAHTDID